jgi:predicted dinucleotide-utilizing enzyme
MGKIEDLKVRVRALEIMILSLAALSDDDLKSRLPDMIEGQAAEAERQGDLHAVCRLHSLRDEFEKLLGWNQAKPLVQALFTVSANTLANRLSTSPPAPPPFF